MGTLSTECQVLLGPRPTGALLQSWAGQSQEGLGWRWDRHSQLCGCPGSPCALNSGCLASLERQP